MRVLQEILLKLQPTIVETFYNYNNIMQYPAVGQTYFGIKHEQQKLQCGKQHTYNESRAQ